MSLIKRSFSIQQADCETLVEKNIHKVISKATYLVDG